MNVTNKKKNQHSDRLLSMLLHNMSCTTDLRLVLNQIPPTYALKASFQIFKFHNCLLFIAMVCMTKYSLESLYIRSLKLLKSQDKSFIYVINYCWLYVQVPTCINNYI